MPYLLATRRLTTHLSLGSAQGALCIMRKLHLGVGATGTRLGFSPSMDGSKLRRGASFKRRLESPNEESQSQTSERSRLLSRSLFGSIVVVMSFALMYQAEHRHRDKLKVLQKMESEIISADAPPGYDCLVHVTGAISIAEENEGEEGGVVGVAATDPCIDLASALPPGFRPVILERKSSMLQWVEKKEGSFETGNNKSGKDANASSEHRVVYRTQWLPQLHSSLFFRDAATHRNPNVMPISSAVFVANDIRLGPFRMGADVAAKVPCSDHPCVFTNVGAELPPVRLDESIDESTRAVFGSKIAFIRSSNEVAIVSSREANSIGDMRLKYRTLQSGGNMYSVICHCTPDGNLVSRHSFHDRQVIDSPIIFPGALSAVDMLVKQRDLDDHIMHVSIITHIVGNAIGAAILYEPMMRMSSNPKLFKKFPRFVVGFGLSLSLSSLMFAKLF